MNAGTRYDDNVYGNDRAAVCEGCGGDANLCSCEASTTQPLGGYGYFTLTFDSDAGDSAAEHILSLTGFRVRITTTAGTTDDYILAGVSDRTPAGSTGLPVWARLSRGEDGDAVGDVLTLDADTIHVY